ncbi:MAG: alkaline phosphatase family protein, partial [Candidatus Nanohaloarchaea archaeon]
MTLIVFGMDGAVRKYIDEAIDRGLMPNTERFIEEGCFGDMDSTIPPVTIPAWVSMFSGYEPDKFDTVHHTSLNEDYEIELRNSETWRGTLLWDRIDGDFGVINVPGTSPVWPVNGFMVEGFPMVEDPRVYPSDLVDELPDLDFVQSSERSTREGRRQGYHKNFEKRRKGFPMIDRDCDVRIEIYQLTDTNAHRSKNFEQVLEAYGKVDEVLGERMDEYDDILLVSDHGFTHVDRYFYINTWLKEKGYLEEKDAEGHAWKHRVQRLMAPLIESPLRPFFKFANDLLASQTGVDFSPKSSFLEDIDFERTEAFSYVKSTANFGDININTPRWSKGFVENREELADEVKEKLEQEDFVVNVWKREEIYDEPENMPDLMFETAEDVGVGPPLFPKPLFQTDTHVHSRTGVVGGWGESFSEGELEKRDIVDVAPTIAHYLGQELECDGSVIREVFSDDFEPKDVSEVSDIE